MDWGPRESALFDRRVTHELHDRIERSLRPILAKAVEATSKSLY